MNKSLIKKIFTIWKRNDTLDFNLKEFEDYILSDSRSVLRDLTNIFKLRSGEDEILNLFSLTIEGEEYLKSNLKDAIKRCYKPKKTDIYSLKPLAGLYFH